VNSSNIEEVREERYAPVLPIIGYRTRVYGKTKEDLDLLLERENIKMEDFKIKSVPFSSSRGTYREIIGRYENFNWELEDNTLFCEFFLPKGEYATVFIDQLVKS